MLPQHGVDRPREHRRRAPRRTPEFVVNRRCSIIRGCERWLAAMSSHRAVDRGASFRNAGDSGRRVRPAGSSRRARSRAGEHARRVHVRARDRRHDAGDGSRGDARTACSSCRTILTSTRTSCARPTGGGSPSEAADPHVDARRAEALRHRARQSGERLRAAVSRAAAGRRRALSDADRALRARQGERQPARLNIETKITPDNARRDRRRRSRLRA